MTLMIYKRTKPFPSEERYGLTSQLRNAVSSIAANIAEGFGRYHFADRVRFHYQARGSLAEVQNFLILAKDLGYLDQETFEALWKQTKTVERLLNGLIRSTREKKEEAEK